MKHAAQDLDGGLPRDPLLALEPCPEGFSLERLHHQIAGAFVEDAEVADADDVRMIETTGCDRLALKPLRSFAVAIEIGVKNFDRDGAPDAGVLAAIDASHPARAEDRIDPIPPVEH